MFKDKPETIFVNRFTAAIIPLLLLASCAGPRPIYSAIRPDDQDVYDTHVIEAAAAGSEKEAFLAWRAEQRGLTLEQARARDEALDRNPFKRNDPDAVSLGALIYMNQCMDCHGELADGRGPAAPKDPRPKDFTSLTTRIAIAAAGGPPRDWFPAVHDGKGPMIETPEGLTKAMPAFADRLANEQIWMTLVYLTSDRATRN